MSIATIANIRNGRKNNRRLYAETKSGIIFLWHRELNMQEMSRVFKNFGLNGPSGKVKLNTSDGNWIRVRG